MKKALFLIVLLLMPIALARSDTIELKKDESFLMEQFNVTLLNIDSKKTLGEAIKKLLEAQKKESENNKLWYLLSVAYGRNSEMGKSKYASAYSFYLKGDDAMALNFIERAKKIVEKDSATWTKLINLENNINLKK